MVKALLEACGPLTSLSSLPCLASYLRSSNGFFLSPLMNQIYLQLPPLTIEPFNLEEAEAFAKAKGNQAGFTDQERDLLLKYGQTEEQRWPPLRLQLVGKMLLGDKLLGEKEGIRYYSPNDPGYWQKFERRLEDKYRGVVY